MASFLGHPQYSDADTNLEDTATLKELDELTMSEKFDFLGTPSPPPTTCLFPTMRGASGDTSRAAVTHLRGNRIVEKKKNKDEKLLVFNDEVKSQDTMQQLRKSKSQSKNEKTASKIIAHSMESMDLTGMHVRSKSAPSVPQSDLPRASAASEKLETGDRGLVPDEATSTPARLEIIQRLHSLFHLRSGLLQQLHDIESEQKALLSSLHRLSLPSAPTNAPQPSPFVHDNNDPSTTLQLGSLDPALVFPRPIAALIFSPYQLRKNTQPQPPLPRPVSVPPQPSPSEPRPRTPSFRKRVPLSDKTAESIARFDYTPISLQEWLASPVKRGTSSSDPTGGETRTDGEAEKENGDADIENISGPKTSDGRMEEGKMSATPCAVKHTTPRTQSSERIGNSKIECAEVGEGEL